MSWYLGTGLALSGIAWKGSPRMRFLVLWMFVTVLFTPDVHVVID